jgi:TorA maturation chaperone TorD
MQNVLSAAQHAIDFVRTRPLSWMPALREAVERESPNGFYASLLQLTQALLELVA